MLDALHVENFALIHKADFEPAPGLTVVTGETGAGKTALLSALKSAMGQRTDSTMVREGEPKALVSARFFEDAHDIDGFTVERTVSSDGRSRVKIDGSIASVKALSERADKLIDLCGQHEHQTLLDPSRHIEMIDSWTGSSVADALRAYQDSLCNANACAKELERVRAAARAQGSKVEEARFICERVDEVDPKQGEFEELEQTLPRAEHAELLISTAFEAQEALQGEDGVLDRLNFAIAQLSDMGSVDTELAGFADSLTGAAIVIEDATADLRRYRERIDFDEEELRSMQERFAALKGLLRQWGPRMEDVFESRDRARELLAVVDHGEAHIKKAQQALDDAEGRLYRAAKKLSRLRVQYAPRFCREVATQLARLEMRGAELIWDARDLPREKWTLMGPQGGELLYRASSGLTPRPLRRIASGGELSRVLLACKTVLGDADGTDTLVFDEVDAGVGGSTARSLASVLKDLSHSHQVIVVTHLAQVAVMGDKHYAVQKESGDIPETHLIELEGDGRLKEIARLLSGDSSEVSLEHARQMLIGAGQKF